MRFGEVFYATRPHVGCDIRIVVERRRDCGVLLLSHALYERLLERVRGKESHRIVVDLTIPLRALVGGRLYGRADDRVDECLALPFDLVRGHRLHRW